MKKFLLHFFLFLLPVVLLAYAADVFLSANLKKSKNYVKGEYTTWNALYENKLDSKIIVVGSSRSWLHFDAQMMTDSLHTGVYNIGMDGYNFWFHNYRVKLAMQAKPKVIIHSIDVFALCKRPDLFYPDQFLPYMLGNSELREVSKNFKGYSEYDYKIPLLRYFGKGKAIIEAVKIALHGPNKPMRIRGFQGNDESWNDDFKEATAKARKLVVHVHKPTIALFEKYLINCKKKNIKIVFVWCPEYIEGQKFIKNRAEIFGIYKTFSEKYNIPLLDYSNDPISYSTYYFYNAEHMNVIGAELFTAKFIKDFRKLNLQY